ncbi:TPA: hypothetical protein ACYSDT_001525 [Klebsiella oxytoca]|uniref:hypothetical protein n=1 Tax=Klebsiella grimontii TaxID=2058152 RepID=UPI00292F3459|nr:hypothetical protein [Klebsiella grimontii]
MSQSGQVTRQDNEVGELQRALNHQYNQLTQLSSVVASLRAEVAKLKKQVAEQGK